MKIIVYTIALTALSIFNIGYAADRYLIERDSNKTLAVFVHGFTGDHVKTWGELPDLLAKDKSLDKVDFLFWGYPTKLFGNNEKLGTIGKHFKTEIDYLPKNKYKNIVLVAHSMGGLVVRSYVVQALIDGHGNDLERIRKIVLLGVPNEGIDKADSVPEFVNDQIADMKTASELVIELRKYWIQRVTSTTISDQYNRKIPVLSVAGFDDNFVPKESVLSYFTATAITDGDHRSMVKPKTTSHLSYRIIRRVILDAIDSSKLSNEPEQSPPDVMLPVPDSTTPSPSLVTTITSGSEFIVTFDIGPYAEASRKSNTCGQLHPQFGNIMPGRAYRVQYDVVSPNPACKGPSFTWKGNTLLPSCTPGGDTTCCHAITKDDKLQICLQQSFIVGGNGFLIRRNKAGKEEFVGRVISLQ